VWRSSVGLPPQRNNCKEQAEALDPLLVRMSMNSHVPFQAALLNEECGDIARGLGCAILDASHQGTRISHTWLFTLLARLRIRRTTSRCVAITAALRVRAEPHLFF
jgi:hypothetical protein